MDETTALAQAERAVAEAEDLLRSALSFNQNHDARLDIAAFERQLADQQETLVRIRVRAAHRRERAPRILDPR